MKVTEIMSRPVITVLPETSVKDAAGLLVRHGISALPVVDAAGDLVGILSEADLVSIEARPDPRSQATPLPPTEGTAPQSVAEVMTSPVITISEGGEVSQAARLMLEADVKRVPVVRNRHVVGIVSRRDLVRIIARGDEEVETEVSRRLNESGLGMFGDGIKVANGVATLPLAQGDTKRMRLAESVALSVPGVLEVRFAKSNSTQDRRSSPRAPAGS